MVLDLFRCFWFAFSTIFVFLFALLTRVSPCSYSSPYHNDLYKSCYLKMKWLFIAKRSAKRLFSISYVQYFFKKLCFAISLFLLPNIIPLFFIDKTMLLMDCMMMWKSWITESREPTSELASCLDSRSQIL